MYSKESPPLSTHRRLYFPISMKLGRAMCLTWISAVSQRDVNHLWEGALKSRCMISHAPFLRPHSPGGHKLRWCSKYGGASISLDPWGISRRTIALKSHLGPPGVLHEWEINLRCVTSRFGDACYPSIVDPILIGTVLDFPLIFG